jgi:hypothetical protein
VKLPLPIKDVRKANAKRMIASTYRLLADNLEAIKPPVSPPPKLIGINQTESFKVICFRLYNVKKLEKELTVLDTLLAPMAE